MKRVGFVYDDIFLKHETPATHPESAGRLTSIIKVLQKSPIWDNLIRSSPAGLLEDIALIHTERYIKKVKMFGTGYLDSDTYMSERRLEAARHAVGAVIEAVVRCKRGILPELSAQFVPLAITQRPMPRWGFAFSTM